MKLKNKDLRKLLIQCYEKRTPKEKDILLKYFMEVETIVILVGEVISMVKKIKSPPTRQTDKANKRHSKTRHLRTQ